MATWIEQYRGCGCSSEAPRKKDLLGYCGIHGTDVMVTYKVPKRVLTDSQSRALTILDNHGPLRPREFARLMWPESLGWQRRSKCGPKGVTKGGGMCLAAGGYLGRLRKKGWAWEEYGRRLGCYESLGYVLVGPGREMLRLHRQDCDKNEGA